MTPCQPHRQHRPVRDPSCKENDNLSLQGIDMATSQVWGDKSFTEALFQIRNLVRSISDAISWELPETSSAKSKKYPPEYHKFITDITTNPLSTPNIKESFWEGDSDIRLPSFSMAKACKGISGRDQASGAGDKSSVFVSPVTLKTQSVT